jgi:hypothetical protein
MSNLSRALIALSFFPLFATGLAAAEDDAEWWTPLPTPPHDAFVLLCRGPVDLAARPSFRRRAADNEIDVAIPFVRNARAAGVEGGALSPGACAWVDRPVRAEEPAVLRFLVSPPNPAMTTPMYRTLLHCALRPTCVFAVTAQSYTLEGVNVLFSVGADVYTYER